MSQQQSTSVLKLIIDSVCQRSLSQHRAPFVASFVTPELSLDLLKNRQKLGNASINGLGLSLDKLQSSQVSERDVARSCWPAGGPLSRIRARQVIASGAKENCTGYWVPSAIHAPLTGLFFIATAPERSTRAAGYDSPVSFGRHTRNRRTGRKETCWEKAGSTRDALENRSPVRLQL